ncbi:MAG: histidine phosphatase family protein [Bryobacteraceae bacterium]
MQIYFFRHGQAGLRNHYDTLSELGREQARALGRYLAAEGIRFGAVVAGALERQRETALETWRAAKDAGLAMPKPEVDAAWNEFDLEGVYREVPPRLAGADPEFAREYEALAAALADPGHTAHHTWMPSDLAIVRAWIDGRFDLAIESWPEFNRRIERNLRGLPALGSGAALAVFTSATPIAIAAGLAVGAGGPQLMRVAGVMYNSAISTFRYRDGDLMLFSFNGVPHLAETRLRTFR